LHGNVLGRDDGGEELDAGILRVPAQRCEQCASDAAPLPLVDDLDRHLGNAGTGWNPYVAGAAKDLLVGADGHERDMLVVVDRGQVSRLGREQRGGDRQEAPLTRESAQPCVGASEFLRVPCLDRADTDRLTIRQADVDGGRLPV